MVVDLVGHVSPPGRCCSVCSGEKWEEPGLYRDFGFDRSNEGRSLARERRLGLHSVDDHIVHCTGHEVEVEQDRRTQNI